MTSTEEQIDFIGHTVKDAGAHAEYVKFVEQEKVNLQINTEIDQNKRIIRAVTSMEAERIFKLVSETKSTVKFASENGIELHFNNEFRIHPLALDQFEDGDLSTVLEKTCNIKSGSNITDVKRILNKKYRMITDTEIINFVGGLETDELTKGLTVEQISSLHQMQHVDAHRLRTVMLDALAGKGYDELLKAAFKLANEYGLSSLSDVADCVEVVKLHIADERMRKKKSTSYPQGGVPRKAQVEEELNLLQTNPQVMNDLKEKISEVCQKIADINSPMKFSSNIPAYYHWRKHEKDSTSNYYRIMLEDLPAGKKVTWTNIFEDYKKGDFGNYTDNEHTRTAFKDYISQKIYFRDLPERLCKEKEQIRISQDGKKCTRFFANEDKLKPLPSVNNGTTFSTYTVFFHSRLPLECNWTCPHDCLNSSPTIASHFQTS